MSTHNVYCGRERYPKLSSDLEPWFERHFLEMRLKYDSVSHGSPLKLGGSCMYKIGSFGILRVENKKM